MTDFFREVEEDLRRDRLEALWKRYGNLLAVAAIILVAGVGAWRYWSHLQDEKAAAIGTRFEEAVALARSGKSEEAEKVLEAIIGEAPSGYRVLARFRLAGELAKRDPAAAASAFEALANDASLSQPLRDLARLRAAMLRLDKGDAATETTAQLEELAKPTNPWRHSARELLGVSALRAGDYERAGRWFDQIIVDPVTPPNLQQRAKIYLGLVRAGPVKPTSTQ